ncbi:MAG: alpha/beta hydrolase [Roseibium sp.]
MNKDLLLLRIGHRKLILREFQFGRFMNLRAFIVSVLCIGLLTACGGGAVSSINLMPSPEVFVSTDIDPFPDNGSQQKIQHTKLFYVTDREPATAQDSALRYTSERGHIMRAGTATVSMSPEAKTWEDVRSITQSKPRNRKYKLSLDEVNEIGPLPTDGVKYLDNPPTSAEMAATGRAFASQINTQLASSGTNDIYIYIHGYKNAFERPVLVSRELQHFLGYQGAFISFGWPATPNNFAYFKDLETAGATVRNLRQLLVFLSENTKARKIHLLGYSAGSRLVFEATHQIALAGNSAKQNANGKGVRLGQVILVGSDIDPSYFGQALADGLLEVPEHFTVYSSSKDAALGFASLVFARPRLGQIWSTEELNPTLGKELKNLDNLSLIDVTDAESSTSGNGHGYFRSSPWVSSDLFLSLIYRRPPIERGLFRQDSSPVWRFPVNYPDLLAQIVKDAERAR